MKHAASNLIIPLSIFTKVGLSSIDSSSMNSDLNSMLSHMMSMRWENTMIAAWSMRISVVIFVTKKWTRCLLKTRKPVSTVQLFQILTYQKMRFPV
jgi:hypothetical protein